MQLHTIGEYKLSQSTIEKLGYYVYLLIDPRNNQIFYVGKGCGNRIYQHILGAYDKRSTVSEKIKRIREIQSSNEEVAHKILRHGLTENEAFEVESAVIDLLGKDILHNEVAGHHAETRGLMTIQDIKINYEAEDAKIEDPVMIININRIYHKDISEDELHEKTRGNWVVGEKREKARFVLSTYRGIVREVYIVEKWEKSNEPKRWQFIGKTASSDIQEKYLHKSIKKYQKQGAQNPIKYVNV